MNTQPNNPMKPAPQTQEGEENKNAENTASEDNTDGDANAADVNTEDGDNSESNTAGEEENSSEGEGEEEQGSEDTIEFTNDDVKDFAYESAEKYGFKVEDIVGTAKNPRGAIKKGDVNKLVTAAEKKIAEEAAKNAPPVVETEEEDEEELDFLDELISFGVPVRGALNTKPKVQARWNEFIERAVKLKRG